MASRSSNRRRRGNRARNQDLWRPVPQLAPVEPIRPASDPTALLRSLGDPPLHGQATVGHHYMAEVLKRAAGLATALAAAGNLLATDPEDEESD